MRSQESNELTGVHIGKFSHFLYNYNSEQLSTDEDNMPEDASDSEKHVLMF